MDITDSSAVAGLLHIISAAVTPVVMISACASLLLTINNKHTNISDRMRAIAAEFRAGQCSAPRQSQLLAEATIFRRRFMLTYIAHVALNIAVIVFIVSVILIIYTQRRLFESAQPTLILFVMGTALMFTAMCCELLEISLSTRSLDVEMSDIAAGGAAQANDPPSNSRNRR